MRRGVLSTVLAGARKPFYMTGLERYAPFV